jgi:hypothetical protein
VSEGDISPDVPYYVDEYISIIQHLSENDRQVQLKTAKEGGLAVEENDLDVNAATEVEEESDSAAQTQGDMERDLEAAPDRPWCM